MISNIQIIQRCCHFPGCIHIIMPYRKELCVSEAELKDLYDLLKERYEILLTETEE